MRIRKIKREDVKRQQEERDERDDARDEEYREAEARMRALANQLRLIELRRANWKR